LLEHFEGPLDFLIYLIQKNGFDLLQVDIAPIASQYLAYMDAMKSLNIELTADYMVMAALLADLKSRLLLPKPKAISELEKDPKQELIDRLENYLRIKQAAERLGQMPVLERDTFNTHVSLGQVAYSN
ncbi:segregation/condensation protein A, partial [Acinetobacter schindleri]